MIDSSAINYPHLAIKADGAPVVERVGFKGIHLIREHLAYGWSAEELALNHPQLTLGEVYSVLTYFADHREVIMSKIRESVDAVETMEGKHRNQRVLMRLREQGKVES